MKLWPLLLALPIMAGCSVPLTAEMIKALKDDPATFCAIAGARGGAGGMVVGPGIIPSGGYGSAEIVICRTNTPGSEIILHPDGTLTMKHAK